MYTATQRFRVSMLFLSLCTSYQHELYNPC